MSTIAENVPPMKFTPNAKATITYRQLGVGEVTQDGDCTCDGGLYTPLAAIGYRITQDDEVAYFRPIQQETSKLPMVTLPTGSKRESKKGKGRFDLIPHEAMLALAKRFEEGADAHGDRNWELGQPLSLLLNSLRRHASQVGHDYSEDHAAAVMWNAAAFITIRDRIAQGKLPKELDDVTPDCEL